MKETIEAEILKVLDTWMEAFNRLDIVAWEKTFHDTDDPEELAAHVMIKDGHWKYVRNRFDIDELYDLKTDPGEMRNLADRSEHQNRIVQMRRQIAEMVRRTGPGPYAWCL